MQRKNNSRIIHDLHPYSSPFFVFFSSFSRRLNFAQTAHSLIRVVYQFFSINDRFLTSFCFFFGSFVTLHFHLIYFHFYFYGSFQTLKYPKSVAFIISNEFCERFNYYGMRSEYIINPISIEGREKPKCDSDMNGWKEAFYESRSILCFFFSFSSAKNIASSVTALTSQQK